MSSPAQRSTVLLKEKIKAFQGLGKPLSFGGITIQLCAFPRKLGPDGNISYSSKSTRLPIGEEFYPFKLGYKFLKFEPYSSIHDVYRLLQWQLIYEKKVRFLNAEGKVVDVKANSKWLSDHLEPIKQILALGKQDQQIDVGILLEAP